MQIEGVPVGTKIKRIGRPDIGEFIIGLHSGIERVVKPLAAQNYAILEPDNVYNVVNLERVPVPDGWERIGTWWQDVVVMPRDTCWLDRNGYVHGPHCPDHVHELGKDRFRIILRKKKQVKRYLVMRTEVPEWTRLEGIAHLMIVPYAGANVTLPVSDCRIEEVTE